MALPTRIPSNGALTPSAHGDGRSFFAQSANISDVPFSRFKAFRGLGDGHAVIGGPEIERVALGLALGVEAAEHGRVPLTRGVEEMCATGFASAEGAWALRRRDGGPAASYTAERTFILRSLRKGTGRAGGTLRQRHPGALLLPAGLELPTWGTFPTCRPANGTLETCPTRCEPKVRTESL